MRELRIRELKRRHDKSGKPGRAFRQTGLKVLLSCFCICLLFLCEGCGRREANPVLCRIVIEKGEGFLVKHPARIVERGSDAVFILQLENGYEWEEKDDGIHSYEVRHDRDGKTLHLTVKNVQYSEALRMPVKKGRKITYYANGADRLDGRPSKEGVEVKTADTHLRANTAIGTDLFVREGFVQTGWNTMPDGSGTFTGLGSRVDYKEGMVLYAQWEPWTDSSCFSYRKEKGFCVITGYHGNAKTVCIPARMDGLSVRRIARHAFQGAQCHTLILPQGIYEAENGAFQDALLREIYFYDDLMKISDYAFEGCSDLRSVHINAVQKPVYSGSYFDTFQDKYDRLLSLKEKKKMVLYSGSSARFGYDSAKIDAAFLQYEIVNMGVFAYSPALPQLLLILDLMQEGDLFVYAPEFDAAKRQFCSQKELDYAVFAMMESDYDTFAKLNIRNFSQVFTAYASYNAMRQEMEKKSYQISACDYDEEGNPAEGPSYNEYGDYILYRPNESSDKPVFGLAVPYTVRAFPKEQYIEPLNRMFQQFLNKGIQVYFTYASRNRLALSKDSTYEERTRLHAYFKKHLAVPVISELEDSLYPGRYLYGTDNHLSTEGVKIRTEKLIQDLGYQHGRDRT